MISLGNAHHECSEAKRALAASQADLAALRQVAALLSFSRVVSGVWADRQRSSPCFPALSLADFGVAATMHFFLVFRVP